MSLFHRRCCLLGFVLAPSLAATSLSGQDRPLDAVAAAMEPTRTVVYFIFDLELFVEARRAGLRHRLARIFKDASLPQP